jgi:hypothetical protein
MNSTLMQHSSRNSFQLTSPVPPSSVGYPSFVSSFAVLSGWSLSHSGLHAVSSVEAYLNDAHVVAAAFAANANRMEAGRIAVAATAWDITGCAPKFQAKTCTTAKNKTEKRPLSWSGPPTG